MKTHIDVSIPQLGPIIADWVPQFLDDKGRLSALFAQYGSPLNFVNSAPYVENYKDYAAVMQRHGLEHLVCFARKANKCLTFVHAARDAGFGVDTASFRELNECLDAGLDPAKLVCTAAVKSEALMRLAIEQGVLVVLDNADEVALAQSLATQLGKRAKVGVRVSGFYFKGEKSYSRFGFDIDKVAGLFDGALQGGMLDFEGFHFHLNGYSIAQRAEAIAALVNLADTLKDRGIATHFIDAGGGMLMNYLSDGEEWRSFNQELAAAQRGERPPLTVDNDGLGLRWEAGEMKGKLNTYPYFNTRPRAAFLEAVLTYSSVSGQPATLLRERGIQLRIEPGRSLLDQCGITVARVAFRKYDSRGELLIGLEMNGSQCRSASADFLVDPVLISMDGVDGEGRASKGDRACPVCAVLVGAYCLEQDFILKRKLRLPFMPQVGDALCFVNTAGYLMHFYERDAHLLGFAQNLVVKEVDGGVEVEVDG